MEAASVEVRPSAFPVLLFFADKVSTLSAFVAPFKHVSPGATSTEDEDNLSTSSADVKENRNVSNLEARPLPVGDRTRGGPPGLKRKRPLEEGGGGPLRQLHLLWRGLSWSVAPKNALVQLHELRPGLQYRTVSQTGPVHAPVFAVAVEVNGLTFEGTGPTKKKAKMRAAELALRSFVQFPNACQAHLALGSGASPSPDFTSDQADFPDTLFKQFEPAAPSEAFPGRRPAAPERLSAACRRGRLLCRPLDLVGTAAPGERNPVVLLNELRSGLRYVCLSEPEKQRAQSFVMAVNVDGRTFEGSGRSKKLAKGQAAQAALQALFDIRLPGHIPSRNKGHLLPQNQADLVLRFHGIRSLWQSDKAVLSQILWNSADPSEGTLPAPADDGGRRDRGWWEGWPASSDVLDLGWVFLKEIGALLLQAHVGNPHPDPQAPFWGSLSLKQAMVLYPLVLPASGQTVTDPGLWCRADRVHCTFSVPPRSTI
ncbi:Double-stranded RNA-specific editase B2 [Camelus dromedarius]|uniref:Double-stranded RNA-specific editase B2 n=1 Tax=Camelus dromedarius TaxID=9838 RepID=A0A5N4C6G0_CAMDR|nr:Double-stranded RNA-specific editase B2 [Camelus dromedarius]